MNAPDRQERALAGTSAACAALVLVVVASSAWLRLATPACPPGGCDGITVADAVRLAHRVAAMGVSVLALLVAALAWKPPARRGLRVASALAIVLVALLAVVGRRSAGAAPPAVLIANLLGGLTLLGLCVGLATAVRSPPGRVPLPLAAGFALLASTLVTGGVLATAPPAQPDALALAHRALSWTTLLAWCLIAFSAAAAPRARTSARLAAAVLAIAAALAVAAPAWPAAPWLHNALATLALCLALAAAVASRGPRGAPLPLPERAIAGP